MHLIWMNKSEEILDLAILGDFPNKKLMLLTSELQLSFPAG